LRSSSRRRTRYVSRLGCLRAADVGRALLGLHDVAPRRASGFDRRDGA
jgi:hypothetical protein